VPVPPSWRGRSEGASWETWSCSSRTPSRSSRTGASSTPFCRWRTPCKAPRSPTLCQPPRVSAVGEAISLISPSPSHPAARLTAADLQQRRVEARGVQGLRRVPGADARCTRCRRCRVRRTGSGRGQRRGWRPSQRGGAPSCDLEYVLGHLLIPLLHSSQEGATWRLHILRVLPSLLPSMRLPSPGGSKPPFSHAALLPLVHTRCLTLQDDCHLCASCFSAGKFCSGLKERDFALVVRKKGPSGETRRRWQQA